MARENEDPPVEEGALGPGAFFIHLPSCFDEVLPITALEVSPEEKAACAKQSERMKHAVTELINAVLCHQEASSNDVTGWHFPDCAVYLDKQRNSLQIDVFRRRVSFTP